MAALRASMRTQIHRIFLYQSTRNTALAKRPVGRIARRFDGLGLHLATWLGGVGFRLALDWRLRPQLGARCLFDDNLYGHSIVPPANGTYRQGLSSIRFASPELGGYCHL